MNKNQLILGDSLEILKTFPDNSIDAIITDPPYFKVKKEQWDRQWDNPDNFLDWLDTFAEQWERILKPNGSLYCFASPRMSARVEVKLSERFNICNHIVWDKKLRSRASQACKEILRVFFADSERIIFAEHYGADNIAKGEAGYNAKCDELRGFIFEPLREYLEEERNKAGWENKDAKIAVNHSPTSGCHWFDKSQWMLPTEEIYKAWQQKATGYFTRPYEDLRREYEDLRREYEDLRREYEDLRRPFFLTADVPYTDVWSFPTVAFYKGKHPCEKPLDLIKHIVNVSTKTGQLILDPFGGSGTTAIACLELNRNYIVIEKEEEYYDIAKKRIEQWHNEKKDKQPNHELPEDIERELETKDGQLKLF